MPNRTAARLIARDRIKNKEKRKRKIRTTGNAHMNQDEFLRMSTRKRLSKKRKDLLL